MSNIIPKHENEGKGFRYSVTEEQITEHQKLSIKEIFQMMESHAKFLYNIQSPEEKKQMKALKGKLGK